MGTVHEHVCLGATGQLDGQTVPKVRYIPCMKVTTKLLKYIVLGKYYQMVCITAFCILSLREETINFIITYGMFSAMLRLFSNLILRSTTTTVTPRFMLAVPLTPVWFLM